MPRKLERKLRREARREHFGKARTGRYTYGTMRKLGWKPKRERR